MTAFKDFPKTGSRQTVVSGPRRSVLIVVACKCAYLAQHLLCLYFVVCVINIGCNLNLVLYPTVNMICVQCKPFLKHTAGKEDGGRRRDTSSKRRERERPVTMQIHLMGNSATVVERRITADLCAALFQTRHGASIDDAAS